MRTPLHPSRRVSNRCWPCGMRAARTASSGSDGIESGVLVLDIVYLLVVAAAFAVIALVASGVEKL